LVGDVLAVDEVRVEQPLLHVVTLACAGGVLRESVCVESVGDDGSVVVEREPDLLRPGGDVGDGLAGDLQSPALLLREVLHGVAGRVGLRVGLQLEALPDDFNLVALRQLREGGLELALADVAERTDDVAPDLDGHLVCNGHASFLGRRFSGRDVTAAVGALVSSLAGSSGEPFWA